MLLKLIDKYKLKDISHDQSSIAELEYLHKKDYVIIIGFYIPYEKEGHYAILRSVNSKHICFYDPYYGSHHCYKTDYFVKIWKNNPARDNKKRWFLAVKR